MEQDRSGGPEAVLFGVLDWQARTGLDHVSLLTLLGLVNLTVILGLVHRYLGGGDWVVPAAGGLPPTAGNPASGPGGGGLDGLLQMAGPLLKNVDPAMLLSLAGPLLGALSGKKDPAQTPTP